VKKEVEPNAKPTRVTMVGCPSWRHPNPSLRRRDPVPRHRDHKPRNDSEPTREGNVMTTVRHAGNVPEHAFRSLSAGTRFWLIALSWQ
jgi:hypothetical protein